MGNDYVKGLAEYFKASFEEMGGTVVGRTRPTPRTTPTFPPSWARSRPRALDVIFLPDYYNKNNLIAAQIKEKGIRPPSWAVTVGIRLSLQLDLFEGGYFSNHYSPADPRPWCRTLCAAYEAKYGAVPDALATLAYDAAKILLQSISEAGVDDPTVVKDAMAAIKYEGVSGDITYDEQHNPVKNAAIVKIEGGKTDLLQVRRSRGAAPEAELPRPVGRRRARLPGQDRHRGCPLSGDVKTFGESTRDGALMAIDEAKAAGWEIEVVIADSKCDAQEAANAANKVIFEDEVKYIIGEVCSSASIPISEIAEANKVLQISPTSTNPAVTVNEDGSVKEYVFRACFLDPFQGEVVASAGHGAGRQEGRRAL